MSLSSRFLNSFSLRIWTHAHLKKTFICYSHLIAVFRSLHGLSGWAILYYFCASLYRILSDITRNNEFHCLWQSVLFERWRAQWDISSYSLQCTGGCVLISLSMAECIVWDMNSTVRYIVIFFTMHWRMCINFIVYGRVYCLRDEEHSEIYRHIL